MTCSAKKHLKRIATPKHWCLDKLSGIYAPKPSAGPHRLRECLPLALVLRNRLKYALTYDEVKLIVVQRLIKIDGKIRTDKRFPCGFMDVLSIDKTNQHFRIMLDSRGRYIPHVIKPEEATYKLCRVRKVKIGTGAIPYAYCHDGRTIRYPHPDVKVNDTLKIDLATNKPIEHLRFGMDALCMVTMGRSCGRVGKIVSIKKHPGTVDMITLRDARGDEFSTRIANVFVIGTDNKCLVTLPKDKGIRKTILEVQRERIGAQ